MDLRANTAVDVLIGPLVDKTDGNTTEDVLTLTAAEIKLSKNGQALALKSNVTTAVFDDDGYYNCELDATDTNTEGNLVLIVHQSANALPVRHEYDILSEAAWDSLYAPKDAGFMDVNIKTVGRADTQETEANNLETACSNYSSTRGLTGTAVPSVAADGVGGLPISDAGGLDMDAIKADTTAILLDTDELQTDDVPTTLGTLATTVDLLDKLGAVNESAAAGDPSATESVMQYVKQIVNILVGTAGVTTYPTEAAPGNAVSLAEVIRAIHADVTGLNGDVMVGTTGANTTTPPTVAAIADAVLDELLAGHVTTDSVGLLLNDWQNGGRLDVILDAINSVTSLLPDAGALTTIGTDTARLTAVRAAVLTDWINAGRLDTILDAIKAKTDLPEGIQKNTALSNFEFLMVNSTDHVTPETGLTVTGTRSIDGGTFAAVSGTIAEVGNGIYQFDALAADTNGDLITWRFTTAGTGDDTFLTFKTIV